MDTSVPGIIFNVSNVCNFCEAQEILEKAFPNGEKGKQAIERHLNKIKRKSKNSVYDCVVGVSGGRDSMFTLYLCVKVWGLKPLAVHFNDGFGNPVAGENMVKGCKILGVNMITVTSDWRESKDLKLAFLFASTPDLEQGTDIGIATALYGVAAKENIKTIIIGQSFRTEGIAPLSWNYLDGKYLHSVHKRFGNHPLRRWEPNNPGFNLNLSQIVYYSLIRGIKTVPLLYYYDYVRKDADVILENELEWKNPGAHYFDDLYQALMTYVHRVKFNINRRIYNYSALVRSGQMTREEALVKSKSNYAIEDPDIIRLCLKRLGLSEVEFQKILELPPKSFRDYPNHFAFIRLAKPLVYILTQFHLLPGSAYIKYFRSGK